MNKGFLSVFAVALVLSMAFVPAATAQDTVNSEDDGWMNTLFNSVTCNVIVGVVSPNCNYKFDFDFNSGSADTVHQSIATQMAFAEDERTRELSQIRNYINRTYGIAMSKAKLTAIEELNNGSSEGTALQEATSDINDFYSA